MKREKGITLIALAITIISMLILAGVSINALNNNGVIGQSKTAKEKSIIANEKEAIYLAWNNLVMNDVEENTGISDVDFENELKKNGNDTKVEYDEEKNYIVQFNVTNHTYLVDKYGNIYETESNEENSEDNNIEENLADEIIYVTLYSDGTLAFSTNEETGSSKTVSKKYTILKNDVYDNVASVPWKEEVQNIKTVNFTDKVTPRNMKNWFCDCTNLDKIENIANLETKYVKDMTNSFRECSSIKSIDVSNFNTRKVTTMQCMFCECTKLASINVSNFNTGKVTNMRSMFYNCTSLANIDVNGFNTENVTDMGWMFYGCTKLASINVSNFNTGKVTTMQGMFRGCTNLTNIDVSNFNTEQVNNMNAMFCECSKLLNIDVSNFNTEKVTHIRSYVSKVYKLNNYKYK